MRSASLTRRSFLRVSTAGGTGLVLGFNLWSCRSSKKGDVGKKAVAPEAAAPPAEPAEIKEINAWIRIGTDDSVTLIVSESEMGQGVFTALPMILAEELDANWDKVKAELAGYDPRFGRQLTGGSTSVRDGIDNLRRAGAAARQMLLGAAAAMWNVPASRLTTEPSVVVDPAGGQRATFGQLAIKAATIEPPQDPPLKEWKDFRIVGKSMPRLDAQAKIDGSAQFGIDVQVPGMLVAQVAHCPVFGGKVKRFDSSQAEKVEGVRKVVEIPTGVAVVADNTWAAIQGRRALKITWNETGHGSLSSDSIRKRGRQLLGKGVQVRNDGEASKSIRRAKRKLDAFYEVPYLAHATMEPLNCTARVGGGECEIWVSHQSPTGVADLAATLTGVPKEKVTVHSAMLGGGFGRRSQGDFVADAVHVAKAIDKPVKVVWSREDDIQGGFYRPVAFNRLRGAVDDDGWPAAWEHQIASPSILAEAGRQDAPVDATSIEGAVNIPYAIPHLRVSYARLDLPVPVWFWRSVGSSQNAYITECFFDELVRLGGHDPLEARLRLLGNQPRHARALSRAAEKAGWGKPLAEGRARGLAVHAAFASTVAQVAEVSMEPKGEVRVHKVVCAVDCGRVVNPDTVRAQMESGIAYGLSAALSGEIEIAKGRAVQSNFHDYPMLRLDQMPEVETIIIAEGDPMGGIGEPGLPPIAPAVCNALLALTGKPIRRLPIRISA